MNEDTEIKTTQMDAGTAPSHSHVQRPVKQALRNIQENIIFEAMKKSGLSAFDLGSLIAASFQQVNSWASGRRKPKYTTIVAILYRLSRMYPTESWYLEKLKEIAS